MTRVVLGSASAGRLQVLRQAGIDPLIVVSGVDEDAVVAECAAAPPPDIVCALAAAKAEAVVRALPAEVATDCVVIGADSMLLRDGQLRGKPATVAEARSQWQTMAGRDGQLYTGHCLLRVQQQHITDRACESAVTTVHFGTPPEIDLTAYLDSGEPLRVAGGFTLDGLGGWFVDRIEGDPSTVIGLSLPLTRALLARLGLSIAALWTANRV